MNELTQLTALCRRLGAADGQADVMARQLMKRADQLATERQRPREEIMAYLLDLVVQGRQGEVPKDFSPPAPGTKDSE